MRYQRGLTLTGFMLWSVLAFIVVVLTVKIGPAYLEYLSIQKQFKLVAEDPALQNASPNSIGGHFGLRAAVENITSIGPGDLDIEKIDGKVVLRAEYTRCEPIVANLRACMDFHPSSAD